MDNNYQQPYQPQPSQQPYQPQPPYQGYQPQYQQPLPDDNKPPMPDSHLAKAIVTTVLICVPFGIVSIIKAANVERLYNEGQIDEAYELANSANKWANWGIIIGIIAVVLYITLYVVIIALMIAEGRL